MNHDKFQKAQVLMRKITDLQASLDTGTVIHGGMASQEAVKDAKDLIRDDLRRQLKEAQDAFDLL